MAKGINKVIIVGNLGQDPETRYMPSGGAVTNCSIATSDTWKDKNTGEPVEKTEWHRIVFFNKLAEIAGEYLKKGSKVYVEGSLRTRKWQGTDGQDKYTTEIVASVMQMLDSRPSNDQGGYQQQGNSHGSAQNAAAQGQQRTTAPSQDHGSAPTNNRRGAPGAPQHDYAQSNGQGQAPAGFDSFDDDIPFSWIGPEGMF